VQPLRGLRIIPLFFFAAGLRHFCRLQNQERNSAQCEKQEAFLEGHICSLQEAARVALCWPHTWRPKGMATTITTLMFVKGCARPAGFHCERRKNNRVLLQDMRLIQYMMRLRDGRRRRGERIPQVRMVRALGATLVVGTGVLIGSS
jgi:hypothetical protein